MNRRTGEPLPFLLAAVERLTEAVERETDDLSRVGPVDYRSHSQRKSQGLLELARLEPTLAGFSGDPRARAAFGRLIARLEDNRRLLDARLRAARTVSELVARAIRDQQSDGTYSEAILRENRR